MKYIALLIACIFAIVIADDVPVISCSFTASIKSHVHLADGSVQITEYEHYSVAKKKFLQSGLIMDWFPRNMTALFVNPNKYTYIQPFFDRKICATIPFRSIIPCFHIAPNATKVSSHVPCATDPSLQCDIWQYKDVEIWFVRSDTNPVILDQVIVKDPDLNMKATSFFKKFDPTAPDPSVFVIPKDQPCANLINDESDIYAEEDNQQQQQQPMRPIEMALPFTFAPDSPYSREALANAAKKAPKSNHKRHHQHQHPSLRQPYQFHHRQQRQASLQEELSSVQEVLSSVQQQEQEQQLSLVVEHHQAQQVHPTNQDRSYLRLWLRRHQH